MILLHVTRREVCRSIDREGISPAYASGRLAASWFVQVPLADWAIRHIQQRYGITLADVAIYTVIVPEEERGKYRRWCRPGVFWSPEVTSVTRLADRISAEDWGYGIDPDEQAAYDQEAQNLNDSRG